MKYIVTIVALTLSIFTTNVMAGTTATINGTVVSSTAIMEDVIRKTSEKYLEAFKKLTGQDIKK